MHFPAAVIAAMALCNQHVVATRSGGLGWLTTSNGCCSTICGIGQCTQPTKEELKKREDEQTAYRFRDGYAWESAFQDKCLKIHDYTSKLDAEISKDADNQRKLERDAEKAAEQPTLDSGIAALPAIRK